MKWLLFISSLPYMVRSLSMTGDCDTIKKDIKYGPSSLLKNITAESKYDAQKRPKSAYYPGKETTDDPDDVYVTLYINSIIEFDELKQTLTTSLIERETWVDQRLTWDINTEAQCVPIVGFDSTKNALALEEKQFEGAEKIIWTPSMDITNIVTREYGRKFAISHPDSSTHKFAQQEVTTTCPMKFGKYPFDKHTCNFDVSTFQHSDHDIALYAGAQEYPNVSNESNLLDISELHTFRIGQFVVSKSTKTTSYQGTYFTLRGQLEFERHADIFAIEIMLPDLLLHISIYASFWIPADSPPARVALCIISALSFRIMRSAVTEKLPPVSYPVWVVDYMAASQAIAVLALIQFGIVCYFVSFENLHDKLFKQFKKSKIPLLIKRQPSKAMILFREAKEQYLDLMAQANEASVKKVDPLARKRGSRITSAVKSFLVNVTTPRHRKKRVAHLNNQATAAEDKATNEQLEQGQVFASQAELDDAQSEQSIDLAMSSFESGIDNSVDEEEDYFSAFEMVTVQATASTKPSANNITPADSSLILPALTKNGSSSTSFRNSIGESSSPKNGSISSVSKKNIGNRRRPRQANVAFDQLNFNLTIPEVMVIAHVRTAFKTYDEDHNGVLRISELQKCLRHFGKYYSTNQVCSLVAAYRQSQGTSLSQHPTMNLSDFFCVLVELDDHEPLEEFVISDWFAIPPSHIVDLCARMGYPILVTAKIMVFFMILQYYH